MLKLAEAIVAHARESPVRLINGIVKSEGQDNGVRMG
jgi:hypothetical protein